MQINKLAKQIHSNNFKKGFWDKPRNEGEVLFLIITELAEMCEADRKGNIGSIEEFEKAIKRQSKFKYTKKHRQQIKKDFFEKYVKDSIADELADAFIRLCDYCIGFKRKIEEGRIRNQSNIFIECRRFENLSEELLCISSLIGKLDQNEGLYTILVFSYLFWLADQLGIPLEKHVKYKMWYNSTRQKMHGKKY